ncbi:YncE family protein [Roseomonas sp. GC11]|uniref:YncE family protein n=1 Tax=Roseomonas sp. GC11 TaxID=2950546 RepID=UPI00210C04CC|nr:YncE family protein [Roseomonas sp. GC11]MCQ4160517.1 YncE family protein [Roseomonas sp. GC11]
MPRFASRLRHALPGLAITGSLLLGGLAAQAQPLFGPLDATASPQLRFSAAGQGQQPIHAGAEVAIAGQGFRPGQPVTLLYGTTALPGGALVADAQGKVAATLKLPADAVAGNHPILVITQAPYSASLATLKISPQIPLSGQAGYELSEARVARGLYQSAYSARSHALFVTSAVGRPPVRQSELLRLDADSLAITARVTPQAAPARANAEGGVHAVYGIGVDDANGTVWVTNSRQDTVAVYRQSDLALVRQFPPGTVSHARDVVVDAVAGKAYASATFKPEVVVFDTRAPEVAGRIEIATRQRGATFSAASLSLDAAAGRLYVVSNSTSEVAVIDTRAGRVEKVFPVPGARGTIGVAHDPQTGRIFVAAQGSDNLVVLDGASGAVLADTPVGAGALNVVFDPQRRRAYVASRGAGTVTVLDADGRILANLGPAPLANHVAAGKDGTIFAVDKSANARGEEGDTLLRIRPRS